MKPVCEVLSKQGLYVHWLVSQGSNTLTAHLTPCTLLNTHPACILQCTGPQWAGRRNKGIYKYIQICIHRIKKKEVIAITENGDLTEDVSTRSSTYIKTLD
jgi:hypothetical protein